MTAIAEDLDLETSVDPYTGVEHVSGPLPPRRRLKTATLEGWAEAKAETRKRGPNSGEDRFLIYTNEHGRCVRVEVVTGMPGLSKDWRPPTMRPMDWYELPDGARFCLPIGDPFGTNAEKLASYGPEAVLIEPGTPAKTDLPARIWRR